MQVLKYYEEELAKKKTTSSKKSFLTRSEKVVKSHLEDLLDNKAGGWLFGERITPMRIARVKTELKVIENLKKQVEKGLKKPATKGLTTFCAKTVGVSGRRKKDGTVKKNHVATKGGKVVAVKKKTATRKK